MENEQSNDKPIIFLDFETTGVEITTDRICQIAIIKTIGGKKVEQKNILINPTIPIPKEATEVHGITDEMVADKPKFKQIAKSFYDYLHGCDLAGYNIVGFDIPLLVEELLRCDVEPDFSDARFIEIMYIYKKLYPRTLSECYKQYTGRELDGAHDALVDTSATIDIFNKMLQTEEELSGKTLDEISDFSFDKSKMVDFAGKFIRNDEGEICFNFGKDKDKPVKSNMGFLNWMLDKDFSQDTIKWAHKIKRNEV